MPLTSLPEDVLLDVLLHISITDLLSVKQTCRLLHFLGSTDYLWHCVAPRLTLPLDLSPSISLASLPARTLQHLAVNAIKLEDNWRKPQPQVRYVTPIRHGIAVQSIDEMRLLPGAEWLVTAQRNRLRGRMTTTFMVWCLKDMGDVYSAASFEIRGYYKNFDVGLKRRRNDVGGVSEVATIALTVTIRDSEYLQIYSVPLDDRLDSEYPSHSSPRVQHSVSRPSNVPGIFYQVQIQSRADIVAATLVNLVIEHAGHGPDAEPWRILVMNTATGVQRVLAPRFRENITRLDIKLYPEHIVLIASLVDTLLVRAYPLPPAILSQIITPPPSPPTQNEVETIDLDQQTPVLDCVVPNLPLAHDFFVSSTPSSLSPGSHLTFVTFRYIEHGPGRLYVVNVPLSNLCPSKVDHAHNNVKRFSILPRMHLIPRAHTAELVQVGESGRRTVWLERNLETEQVRLMKLHSPPSTSASCQSCTNSPNTGTIYSTFQDSLVGLGPCKGPFAPNKEVPAGVLLHSYPELPFRPESCRSLAWDETKGRLGLGLFTGELYVLDFV